MNKRHKQKADQSGSSKNLGIAVPQMLDSIIDTAKVLSQQGITEGDSPIKLRKALPIHHTSGMEAPFISSPDPRVPVNLSFSSGISMSI